jgi:hypothetical protein
MTTTDRTPVSLTPAEEETLRVAAHGVVGLMAAADPGPISSTRIGYAAGKALSTATGLVGRVAATAPTTSLKGSFADLADTVLPSLTATVHILDAKAPAETENFRATIRTITASAIGPHPRPAQASIAAKIDAALEG